jgi:hypothetical protein
MTDREIVAIRPARRRHDRRSGPERVTTIPGLAATLGSGSSEPVGPASPEAATSRPTRDGLGRWLWEMLVISFAHGGCIHNIHPDYVDVLHDLRDRPRRET